MLRSENFAIYPITVFQMRARADAHAHPDPASFSSFTEHIMRIRTHRTQNEEICAHVRQRDESIAKCNAMQCNHQAPRQQSVRTGRAARAEQEIAPEPLFDSGMASCTSPFIQKTDYTHTHTRSEMVLKLLHVGAAHVCTTL